MAPTAYPLGGVSVWLSYLLNGLQSTNAKVVFGAVSGKHHNVERYCKHYPFDSVERIECGVGSEYERMRALARVIDKVQPTMVLCVNIPDVYRATRYLRSKGRGKYHCISTIHGVLPRLFQDLIAYRDVIDHVIVTNKLTELMVLKNTEFQASELHYAPYGVEEHWREQRVLQRSQPIKILYSGRIDKAQKRCQDLVEICDQLCEKKLNFELIIAGSGNWKGELLQHLDQLAVTHKRGELYRDLGVVRYQDMVEKVYHQADCLLLTSDWETGPIVVWEAMACGMSVVTSRYNGALSEGALKHEQNCLMFDIGDAHDAASQLERLYDNELRTRLITAARALVKTRYSRESSIAQWRQTLANIASKAPAFDTPTKVDIAKNGRLEKITGLWLANAIRKVLKRTVTMNSAGDEWPHAHASADAAFNLAFSESLQKIECSKELINNKIES